MGRKESSSLGSGQSRNMPFHRCVIIIIRNEYDYGGVMSLYHVLKYAFVQGMPIPDLVMLRQIVWPQVAVKNRPITGCLP